MALSDSQITAAWERLIAAETYAVYFGTLASRYSKQRQFITFLSFFFSSGAVITVLSRLPVWVPAVCSLIVAMATAYSVALNLESKTRTMAKLHYSWLALSHEYEELWERTWADGADRILYELMRREQELSALATTDAPNDQQTMLASQNQVFKMRHLAA